MIKIIECPNVGENADYNLFLAGGITNCPDWQSELIKKLKNLKLDYNLNVYNPRRKIFSSLDEV